MVKGLDLFARHFAGFEDSFVLIGGAACDVWMSSLGLRFRATKDLDMVIVADSGRSGFAARFWEFIRMAEYQTAMKSTGEKVYYRFQKPVHGDAPFMLELFARPPFALSIPENIRIVPLPSEDGASSLSAIVMDEEYYDLVTSLKTTANSLSLPIAPAGALIPLKARAWLELSQRKERGEPVDSRDIRKHRNDIFLLINTLAESMVFRLPAGVFSDMKEFISRMRIAGNDDQAAIGRSIGSDRFRLDTALDRIVSVFMLNG